MEEPQSWPEDHSQHNEGDDRSQKTAEKLRTLRAQADETLAGHRRRVSDIETELNLRLQQIAEELARDRVDEEMEAAATADLQTDLEGLQTSLVDTDAEIESLQAQLEAQASEHQQQLDQRQAECSRLSEELSAAEQVGCDLRAQECADCASASQELSEYQTREKQHQQQLQTLEARCQELEESRSDTVQAFEQSQASSHAATALLKTAEDRILELDNDHQDQQQQLQQFNRKFELALTDVQKLKRENAELHAELASRPAASDEESPELVSLRSERDALAARVSELESAPPQTVDADMEQGVADLQRRFELAVDDVRQLKQENIALHEQLDSQAATAEVPAIEGSDWQAQKARLLAELDAEDQGTLSNERRASRATIEGTISITDQVVAKKDEEITKLEAALQARPAEEEMDQLKQTIQEEIFGNDELIQAERRRLEEIQQEWQEKLRKAELEISVERAKLARNQSALEEKLANLPVTDQDGVPVDDSKPRRRWLSAMGIGEEDESN